MNARAEQLIDERQAAGEIENREDQNDEKWNAAQNAAHIEHELMCELSPRTMAAPTVGVTTCVPTGAVGSAATHSLGDD